MRTRGRVLAVGLIAAMFTGFPAASVPQGEGQVHVEESQPPVLKGLKSVFVIVGLINGSKETDKIEGLKKEDVQKDIERLMQQSAIHPDTVAEGFKRNDGQSLLVYVQVAKVPQEAAYIVQTLLTHNEVVRLKRNPNVFVYGATTWRQSRLGFYEQAQLGVLIREDVKSMVKQYIKDFLKVNPKK